MNKLTDYRLVYDCGSLFKYPWSDDLYVYFFSLKGKDYVTFLNDCENNEFIIYAVDLDCFQKVHDRLTQDSLIDMLKKMGRYVPNFKNIFLDTADKFQFKTQNLKNH